MSTPDTRNRGDKSQQDPNPTLANKSEASYAESPANGNMVLVVSRDGSICDVLEGAEGSSAGLANNPAEASVESLGLHGLTERVRHNTKRALRSRQVLREDFQCNQKHFELTFIAQGRDRVLLIIRNVSEQKNAISRVRHLAYMDEPTGLPNREFLLAELGRITDELRLKGRRGAVLCFDIDKLDLSGYASGTKNQDAVLQVLAARLTNGLRSVNDTAPEDPQRYSIAARTDFRQFAVILPAMDSGSDAAAVAERLADSLQQPIRIENKDIKVSARAGIALFPQDGTDAMTLFENSIAAMTDAKSRQTGLHKFHSGTVNVRALQRQDMELELKSALHREELDLHYLPIVAAHSREVVTTEALLRWPQTTLGEQSIQSVVSLAEHTGMIVPIGEWVMHRGCEQLRAWHESGYTELRLAVNLSVQEFSRPDLAQRIAEILELCSIEPQFLDCEITEHMLFRDAMKNYATCRQLKELGTGILLDDYGTGVCSLANLAHSPIDAIKIDNSFVANSATDTDDEAACAAATAMAHELGMSVIAEGVETHEQAEMLQTQGCDFLQGFLFCKPSPANQIG